jgi:hypothetical protein
MHPEAAEAGHGESASPADRQQTQSALPTELRIDNMTTSSSPFPSLSPSPASSPNDNDPLANLDIGVTASADSPQHSVAFLTENPRLNPGFASSSTDGPLSSNRIPSPDAAAFPSATDGLAERLFRSKTKGPIAAIFIHAGAGFHSTVNEHVHLEACSECVQL